MQARVVVRIGLFSVLGLAAFPLMPATPVVLLVSALELRAGWSVAILYEIAVFVVAPWLVLVGLWDLARRVTRERGPEPTHQPDHAGAGGAMREHALPILTVLSTSMALAALLGCVIYDSAVDLAVALLRLWFGFCLLAAPYHLLRLRRSAAIGYLLPLAMLGLVALLQDEIARAVDPVRAKMLHHKFGECIGAAASLGGGNFAVCEASEDDYSVTATLIVYDSTDQIARRPERRSAEWKSVVQSLPNTPFGVLDFTIRPLGGHLYKVTFFDHDGLTGL